MTNSEQSDIRRALVNGRDRPAYMVLRHAGIEPVAATDALFGAGLQPKHYSIECRQLTPEQIDLIVRGCRS
jgi:hypothetical protein